MAWEDGLLPSVHDNGRIEIIKQPMARSQRAALFSDCCPKRYVGNIWTWNKALSSGSWDNLTHLTVTQSEDGGRGGRGGQSLIERTHHLKGHSFVDSANIY